MTKRWWSLLPVVLLMLAAAGCGATRHSAVVPGLSRTGTMPAEPLGFTVVPLIGFRDAWPNALPRWKDIGDVTYTPDFQTNDSATMGSVAIAYNPDAPSGVLETKVWAEGLKPNFCYQIKLMGKPGNNPSRARPSKPAPVVDPGLWGSTGQADMESNTRILRAGRYWDYGTETEHWSTTDRELVIADSYYKTGWTAGYILLGCFVTDGSGGTGGAWVPLDGDDGIRGSHGSYHVIWKTGQTIYPTYVGPYTHTLDRSSPSAYPASTASENWSVYCEREPGVAQPYRLPAGTYNVVLIMTEESFHNLMGGSNPSDPLGGFWDTVRVTDWSPISSPVSKVPWIDAPGTPVQFTVPPPPVDLVSVVSATYVKPNLNVVATSSAGSTAVLTATAGGKSVTLTWNATAQQFSGIIAPLKTRPATVTVTSSLGGSATASVQ